CSAKRRCAGWRRRKMWRRSYRSWRATTRTSSPANPSPSTAACIWIEMDNSKRGLLHMKKSVFRMLALVLSEALVLGACTRGGGGDGGAGSTDGTGQTETVTLKVIMEEVPDTDIVM